MVVGCGCNNDGGEAFCFTFEDVVADLVVVAEVGIMIGHGEWRRKVILRGVEKFGTGSGAEMEDGTEAATTQHVILYAE